MNALNSAYLDHGFLNAAGLTGDIAKLVCLFFFGNGRIVNILVIWMLAEAYVLAMISGRLAHKVRRRHGSVSAFSSIRELDYKRYYHYAKYFAFASLGTFMLSAEFDYLFLSFFDNRDAVGLYAFAAKLPFILVMLAPSNIMFNITLPLLIERTDAGQKIETLNARIVTFLKLNIFAWTVMAGVVAFNIESIISLVFDPKYLVAKNFILGWFMLLYALVIKNVFEPVARALEYAKVYRLTFLAAIVNLLGNFCFIPLLGLKGAMLATGIAITLQGYLSSYETMRKMHLPFNRTQALRLIARILLVALFIFTFNVPFQSSIGEQLWRNSLLVLVLGLLFWPSIFFSPADRHYIFSFITGVHRH
jgi:O-antigen/teichoic acid export membrane protein